MQSVMFFGLRHAPSFLSQAQVGQDAIAEKQTTLLFFSALSSFLFILISFFSDVSHVNVQR